MLIVRYPARYMWHVLPNLTPPPPPPRLILPSRCVGISPIFYYSKLCGWYEGNWRLLPVHFTLVHRLSAAIFHPVGVTPDISKLNLTMPECTNYLFYKMTYKWIPSPSSSPPTPNTTFRSHPSETLHNSTGGTNSKTKRPGLQTCATSPPLRTWPAAAVRERLRRTRGSLSWWGLCMYLETSWVGGHRHVQVRHR